MDATAAAVTASDCTADAAGDDESDGVDGADGLSAQAPRPAITTPRR
jgi:hypothetical protein